MKLIDKNVTKSFKKYCVGLRKIVAIFFGKRVCLDGDNLIASGEDAKEVYAESRAKDIKILFIEQIREKELSAYWGGRIDLLVLTLFSQKYR